MKLEYEIANRIKELRLAENMTQEQLAEKIGVDTSFLLFKIQVIDMTKCFISFLYLKMKHNYWTSLKVL